MSRFTWAGVSTCDGKTKVRFANDQMRIKVLAKNGHKGIDLVQLKEPMTKEEICAYLLKINFDNGNKAVRAAIEAAATKRGIGAKAKAPAKAKTTAKKAPAKAVKAPAKTSKTPAKKSAVKKPAAVVPTAAKPVDEAGTTAVETKNLEDAPF